MKKIFIGGSRKLSRLNSQITAKIDSVVAHNHTVLIGDANGADKAIQIYLRQKHYDNVIVYCMENDCRNNVGDWHTNLVKPPHKKKDAYYYEAKDLAMAKDADYGFMIWDGRSKGTFKNILNLMREEKYTILYFSPEKRLHFLNKVDDMKIVLTKCEGSDYAQFAYMIDTIIIAHTDNKTLVSETASKYKVMQQPLF